MDGKNTNRPEVIFSKLFRKDIEKIQMWIWHCNVQTLKVLNIDFQLLPHTYISDIYLHTSQIFILQNS